MTRRLLIPVLAFATPLFAWVYRGASWPSGEVPLVLHADSAGAPTITSALLDGSTSWNAILRESMAEWNEHMDRTQLVEAESNEPHARANGLNEIFFSDSVYGEDWGEFAIGVTLSFRNSARPFEYFEGDIIFKSTGVVWNSYRGNDRVFSNDLRRVATHELGHLIGLDHPDEDVPAQTVDAIMNSTVSDTDLLTADDIEGAATIYAIGSAVPVFTLPLQDQTVDVGDITTFRFEVDGEPPPAEGGDINLSYYWFYPELLADNFLFTMQDPELFIGAAQPYDAGTYSVLVATTFASLVSEAELTVNPVTTSPDTTMANISTRAYAGTGAQTLQVGFVVSGTGTKRVLIRAVGPTLGTAPYNLPGVHADPSLTLIRRDGPGGTIATNDDWGTGNTATPAEIRDASSQAGAFAIPDGSKDAVLLLDLEPGVYSALVEGTAADEGLVIVEAYDVDEGASTSELANLSTRGFVGTGFNIMIAGLVVDGPGPRTYLIRAIGDTLQDYGVEGYLDDTLLKVFNSSGEIIRIKDDWDDPIAHQPMLVDAMAKVGAFPIPHDTSEGGINYRQESITLLTLDPGSYSLHVTGFDDLQGVALIEIYDYPDD